MATNLVASRPPQPRLTGTPTARANISILMTHQPLKKIYILRWCLIIGFYASFQDIYHKIRHSQPMHNLCLLSQISNDLKPPLLIYYDHFNSTKLPNGSLSSNFLSTTTIVLVISPDLTSWHRPTFCHVFYTSLSSILSCILYFIIKYFVMYSILHY